MVVLRGLCYSGKFYVGLVSVKWLSMHAVVVSFVSLSVCIIIWLSLFHECFHSVLVYGYSLIRDICLRVCSVSGLELGPYVQMCPRPN